MTLDAAPAADRTPTLDLAGARTLVRDLYGVDGRLTVLPSERDRNFLVQDGSQRYVLKVAQRDERAELLAAQNAVMRRLAEGAAPYRVPGAVPTRAGREVASVSLGASRHLVRLMTWVAGEPMARVGPWSSALLRGVGRLMGTVDRVLAGVREPALERDFYWDLRGGAELVARHLDAIPAERRGRVEPWLEAAAAAVTRLAPELRIDLIHADANDWNVIVAPAPPPRVVGLIDFGDMVRSWRVAEPAIAATYAMMGAASPVAAGRAVVAGYEEVVPLTPPERAALLPLIRLRALMSVTMAAHQRSLRPDNAYLSISERRAWALLHRLDEVPPGALTDSEETRGP